MERFVFEILNINYYLFKNVPSYLGRWLLENDLICKRNEHALDPAWDVQIFHYLNHNFVIKYSSELDELVNIGMISLPDIRAIKLDCEINQFVEEHYDEIMLGDNPGWLVDQFSSIFHGMEESGVLGAFDFLRYMKLVHDGADAFLTKKKKMVEEYFTEAIVEVVDDGRRLDYSNCIFLTGNGFNFAVTSVGSEYTNADILSRLRRLNDKGLPYGGRTASRDFRSVARLVNQIMKKQDLNLIESKIRDGRFVAINGMSDAFEPSVDMHEFNLAHQVMLNAYRYQLNPIKRRCSRNRIFLKRRCNISIRKLSFDELLYLFSEACRSKVEKQLPSFATPNRTYEQLNRYIQSKKECGVKSETYEKLLALSLYNDGRAMDRKAVRYEATLRPHINVTQCFTTNYDSFCDFYFSCPVVHLHGSFFTFRNQNGTSVSCAPDDKASALKMAEKNNGFSLLINIKDKLRTPSAYLPEYESLGRASGTVVIFGFSGEYDDELANRIAYNSNIDKIIFCYHRLDDAVQRRGKREIKREAMYYFSKMAKKIIIVDPNTIYQNNNVTSP